MATKNSKKSYKNTQSSLKQKHTKPFMPYPTGSHSYQRIPHNESPFTKTLRLALVSHSLPTFHFPLSVFHFPFSTFHFPLSHSATQLLSHSHSPSPNDFFQLPTRHFIFFPYLCSRFWFPPRGAKRESGASPEQSRCCEFQRVRTTPHKGSLWSKHAMGRPRSRRLDDRSGVKAPVGAGRPKWSQGPYWGRTTEVESRPLLGDRNKPEDLPKPQSIINSPRGKDFLMYEHCC